MFDFLHTWWFLPRSIKVAICIIGGAWIVFSIGLSFSLQKLLPKGRAGISVSALFFLLVLTLPIWWGGILRKELSSLLNGYAAQKKAIISEKCREATDVATLARVKPIRAEGLLIAANYDKLLNDRFRRNIMPLGNGYMSGNYPGHPIQHVFPDQTFAASAYALLTQRGFSYVEIEMIPDGHEGNYSNASHLNPRNWSGTRYRLYYLAPGDHPNCVNERGEGEISGVTVRAEDIEELKRKRLLEKPVCLARDITDKPVSKVRVDGDELDVEFSFNVTWRKLTIPMETSVHADRIQITGNGGEQYTYLGFNYPDEVSPEYRCTSSQVAGAIVGMVLVANGERSFYQGKSWYQGSAVQRFYEPDKAAILGNTQPAR